MPLYYLRVRVHKEWVRQLSNATIYISKNENKLHLEIIEKDKREDIYFIDRVDGYEFKNIREAKKHLENGNVSKLVTN